MKNLDQLLEELIELDPKLKVHKKELYAVLARLIQEKPDVEVDARFVAELREILHEKMSRSTHRGWNPFSHFSWASGGIALGVLVTLFAQNFSQSLLSNPSSPLVRSLGDQAFEFSITKEPVGVGGAGEIGGGGGIYEPINYEFVYEGDPIDLPEETVVYKRTANDSLTPSNEELSSWLLGLIDDKAIDDSIASTVYFTATNSNAFSVSVDFSQQVISLSRASEVGLEASTLSNEEAVQVAKDFIKDYGISTKDLGDPRVVETYPEDPYKRVDFPYLLNGEAITYDNGMGYGLQVYIDSNKSVTYVSEIRNNHYLSSNYKVSDWKDLSDILKNGGVNGYYHYEDPVRTEIIEVGTPEIQNIVYSDLDEEGRVNEYIVPSLVFPVHNEDDLMWVQPQIAIPLAEGLITFENLNVLY